MTATTATRNATDTMMPTSVKNERSLWLHAAWRACRMASVNCMARVKTKREDSTQPQAVGRKRFPASSCKPASDHLRLTPWGLRLCSFVPQRFHRIEPRRAAGGVQAEADARQGRRGERRYDGPHGHVGRDGRDAGEEPRDEAAHQHPDRAAHERERRRLDQELPQDFAPRRAQRLAHADLAGPL